MAWIKSAEQILADIEKNSSMEICIDCKQEKAIPIVRSLMRCDDCFAKAIDEDEAEKKKIQKIKRVESMRIPKRYWNFDITQLEIGKESFDDYCQPGQSIAISGEIGTGKTNLTCQFLIARNDGVFYTANEINTKIAEKIQDEKLIILDDLTEVDSTSERKIEALRLLFHYRYGENLDTIITLSRPYSEVERIFREAGQAMVSRFKQWMYGIVLKKKWR